MKGLDKLIVAVFCSLLSSQVALADISDLNEELVEAEAITSDSEAAIIEAQELKQQLAEDRAEAKKLKAKLSQEKETAHFRKKKAESEIAANEKKITDVKATISQYQKELLALEKEQQKIQAKNEKVKEELNMIEAEKEKVASHKAKEEENLSDLNKKHKDIKANAKKTAIQVSALRAEVSKAKQEIAKVYRDMKKDQGDYKKMIKIYRQSLTKSTKLLDELEMAIEIDRAYDQKLTQMGRLPKGTRTVSGLNRTIAGKVKTGSCDLRAFPSAQGDLLGNYKGGQEIQMKYHSKSWYTVVHGGEKAFVGKKCFN